jgi:cardiolipin synthase
MGLIAFLRDYGWIILIALDYGARIALAVRVILRRTPVPDTLAWLVLLLTVPLFSLLLYALIGENRLGSRRARRFELITRTIETKAAALWKHRHVEWQGDHDPMADMARLLTRLSGMPALAGNHLELIGESQHFLDQLIADIDGAKRHVHLLFYIWEHDQKGRLVAEAVVRARARNVECRVLVDSVGSSSLLGSEVRGMMTRAGASVVEALPASALRALFARVDLRNHRKIAVIDGTIAYCGSQNITEENFRKRTGSRAGPWIDATVRVQGPAVHALQTTFLRDYALDSPPGALPPMDEVPQRLQDVLPELSPQGDSVVHVIPSGPGPRPDAIHQAFLAMLYKARQRIVMTTPYFVPDEATKGALINAALRGVDVTCIVPRVSDSILVAAASRSHYLDLLEAGVRLYEHRTGLLHAKVANIDETLSVIGSANFDMRSFWLNFEVTLFVYDHRFSDQLRYLQRAYLQDAEPVSLALWKQRPAWRRFLDNSAQLLGPLL